MSTSDSAQQSIPEPFPKNGVIDTIIRHATVITQNDQRTAIKDGAVAIHHGQIVSVGADTMVSGSYSAMREIDASNRPLFPGLVNTHTHLFQSAVKGLGEDLPLGDWLRQVTVPTSQAMTADELYIFALLSCVENIRSGATTINEFSYPLPDSNMHAAAIRAMNASGLRGRYSRGIVDGGEEFGSSPRFIRPIEQSLAHVRQLRTEAHSQGGLIDVGVAIGIIWGMTEHGLRAIRAFANDTGVPVSMHVNEVPFDAECSFTAWGKSTVPMLESTGLLGPDFLPVHCVHMSAEDIHTFARHGVPVSYNAVSNMILGSGIPPIAEMMRAGINVCIATDGSGSNNSNDMLESLKFSALLQRAACRDAAVVTAPTAVDWATRNGARAMNMFDKVGSIEVGKRADMFIFDSATAKSTPLHDPIATLVHSSSPANMHMVMVDGNVLLEHGRLTRLDEAKLIQDAQQMSAALSQRCGTHSLLR